MRKSIKTDIGDKTMFFRHILRKSFLKYIVSILFVILFLLIDNNNVFAGILNNGMKNSYDIQIFANDQKFDMPKNVSSYFFNISKGAELNEDCYIDLHYKVSDTLINNLSNIIISINGTPIDTKWVNYIKESSPDWWRISIPRDKLKIGAINEIAIQSNQRSIEGDCADIDNPSNWITLYNDSKIHLSIKSLSAPLLKDFYSLYFENFMDKKTLDSEFILSEIKDKNSIEILLKVSSSIGNLYSDRSLINYEVKDNGLGENNNKNKVVIGKINDLLNYNSLKLVLPKDKLKSNQGFLSISDASKEKPYYKTVISGENKKAVDFISNNNLLNKIESNSLEIDSQIENKYSGFSQNKEGYYKFSDWGYSDINLAGAFHQKASFSFVQPNGLQSGSGSYINVKFKHSKLLVSDRSLLTVYINGKVIDSEKLSNSNADSGNLKINIPENALKQTIIKVDINCYNYIGKIDCSKDYYDSAWTAITADSEVYLSPGKVGIPPSLENFPFFIKTTESKQHSPVMIFPKEINNKYLEIASTIASRAGQNSKQAFNWSIVKEDENLTKDQKENDMIFIGAFNNIKLPKEIKTELPIVPMGNNKFNIKEGLQVVPETLKNKIVIQVVISPWNFYKRIYVVTYDNKDNLNSLKDILSNTDYLGQMGKQISIIDNSKDIYNISFNIDENNKIPITTQSIVELIENKTGLPLWIILIILILLIIGIISVIRLRKIKNQFKDAVNKIRREEGFSSDENESDDILIEKSNLKENSIDDKNNILEEDINNTKENLEENRIDYGNDLKYEKIRKSRKARRGRKENRKWFFNKK